MSYQCISIAEAEAIIQSGEATLLDIRDSASFSAGHIKDAAHLTNENVADIMSHADKEKPMVIYCYHGNSSKGAADYFYNQGFKQSYSVDGGYEVWKLTATRA